VANWKQVQGRIRKAKAASDAAGELTRLYESTRDAMVAFELARVLEKTQQLTDAVVWYRTSAERFRRTEWRQKAIDAISNLGGTPPTLEELEAQAQSRTRAEAGPESGGEAALSDQQATLPMEEFAPPRAEAAAAADESEAAPGGEARKKRTRRGRRGGRGRRKRGEGRQAPAAASQPVAAAPRAPSVPAERHEPEPEPEYERPFTPRTAPPPPPPTGPIEQLRGRSGDPGLASRSALLESQLRRLFAAGQYSLAQAEEAPAGPGVFLISDSDQITHYYVEACRTLRIAIGHALKTERGKRSGGSLKGRLADHLGVSEPKALKYLKDHCTVRWLQLDQDSQYLANFAIAILRPVLNVEED